MADLPNPNTAPAIPARVVSADRRRPGRVKHMHPALVALLREPHRSEDASATSQITMAEDQAAAATKEQLVWSSTRDELGPTRGIAVALLLTLPFWCAIAYMLS